MSNDIIVYIVLGLVVLVVVHVWLHRLLKFKMDESAIIKFLQDSANTFELDQYVSKAVKMPVLRVTTVCISSQKIINAPQDKKAWGIK